MIVIISHPDDIHAARVLELLYRAGQPVLLLNLADLPGKATLTVEYDKGRLHCLQYAVGDHCYNLAQASAVWWRRPQAPILTDIRNAEVAAFTHNEWQEAVNGLWQLIGAPWMNPPARDEVAARKALQLKVAGELGLRIPRTLITSDPSRAREFIHAQGLGKTVFKTFSCTHAVWRETRLVKAPEMESLDSVRLAPVIFQEYIPAEADVRITVVGRRVFPAAIYSQDTDYPVDFRMALGQARTAPCELPSELAERLLALTERLGLVYGAIDCRRTPDGEYVFLEINTAGEFLFVEERTGLPITRAVVDWLIKPV